MVKLEDAKAGTFGPAAAVPSARLLAILAIVAGFAVSMAVNLPGHMSYDSVLQLAQGRDGVYNEWHPPVMAWLLGLCDGLVRGTGLFVVLDGLMLYGSLLAFALIAHRPSWAVPVLALAYAATPDWLIYPGIVWKDVLFAGSALAGFAALAWAEARWDERRTRLGLIVLAFALLSLASLSRQNGILVLPAAAAALAVAAARHAPALRLRAAAAHGLIPLLAAAAVVVGSATALHLRSDGEPSQAEQVADLQAYDLAGALHLRPGLRMDLLDTRAPELARLLRSKGAAAYTPERIDELTVTPDLESAIFDAPPGVLQRQWLELVLRNPALYLQVRAADFAWVLFTPDIDSCVPFFVGVEGPEPWVSRLHLTNHKRPGDRVLEAYGEGLTATPLFWHGLYAAAALAMLLVLGRRRAPGDVAVAAMLVSALLFTASFFVISVACDYRYLYFLDVAAMAAGLYLAASAARADLLRAVDWRRPRTG